MASNVVRMSSPPQPSQQGWVWNGSSWCWFDPDDCPAFPCPSPCPPPVSGIPFPCPPSGFPTPCPPWFPPPAGQAPWYPGANGGVSFSATPPVNPIRGNLWWDGTMLHLFDGAAWVQVGPGAVSPPITGITDGSNVAPGQVGEFMHFEASFAYAGYPNTTNVTLTMGILTPGDWDLWASMSPSTFVGGGQMGLSPVPTGMSNAMGGNQGAVSATGTEATTIISMPARGNFIVPTTMSLQCYIFNGSVTGLTNGNCSVTMEARRRR